MADSIQYLQSEVERLKAGKFTPEEIHDICHNLHNIVDAKGFADGCAAEQKKLYGCSPDRDALKRATNSIRALLKELEDLYEGQVAPHTRYQAVIEEAKDILLAG